MAIRIFYNEIRNIVTARQRFGYRCKHILNITINICFIARFAHICFAIKHAESGVTTFGSTSTTTETPHFCHNSPDVFALIFNLQSSNDCLFIVTFILLFVASATLETKLYFSDHTTLVWQVCECLTRQFSSQMCLRCRCSMILSYAAPILANNVARVGKNDVKFFIPS